MPTPYNWPLLPDPTVPAPSTPGAGGAATEPVPAGVPSFLGLGILTPFQRDQKNDFAVGSGVALVKASMRQILMTRCRSVSGGGEVPWRTGFGSRLYLLRHRKNNFVTQEMARVYVVGALRRWEPRVQITKVTLRSSGRELHIDIRFNLIDRNSNVLARDQQETLPLLS